MEVLIRPFRPEDWDGVFLLDQVCFVPPYRLEYPRLRALVEDPTVAVLVVEGREEVAVEAPQAASEPQASEAAPDLSPAVNPSSNADSTRDGTDSSTSAETPVAPSSTPKTRVETAIVGGLLLKWDIEGARVVILSVMVEPGFRRVGLGRRLIGWAERIAQARRLPELLAPLEAENPAGAAFLGAMGFSREPGAPPFFADPAGGDLWRRGVTVLQEAAPAASDQGVPAPEEPR